MPQFIFKWSVEINRIIDKATDSNFKLHDLKKLIESVQNVLRYHYYFRSTGPGTLNEGFKQVSPWNVIAAVCCVCYSLNYGLNFKPHWQGQAAQGGSVNTSISMPFWNRNVRTDNIPEEHRVIIVNCFEVIADAMRGHSELREKRFAFRTAVVRKVFDISNTNDINAIAENLNAFTDMVAKTVAKTAANQ